MKHFRIAIALIWREGRVLVTRRLADADHLAGVWEFPGGKCEANETPHSCVIREVQEELGVEVEITCERETITHTYPERSVTLHSFDCAIIAGEPRPLQAADLRWLAPHELKAEDFPAANASLLEAIQHKTE